IGLGFAPVFLCMYAYRSFVSGKSRRVIVRHLGVAVFILALLVGPWLERNKIEFGHFSLSSVKWYVFYNYTLPPFAEAEHIALPVIQAEPEGTRLNFTNTPAYEKASLAAIQHDAWGFAGYYLLRAISSLFTDRYVYLLTEVLPSATHRIG